MQSFDYDNRNQDWAGGGHDGENLWVGANGRQEYWVMDDGIVEVQWITIDTEEGVIEGGGDIEAILTFDLFGLIEGSYEAELQFMTNDPQMEEFAVPVFIEVVGAADIDAEWSEELGFPESIHWNEIFPLGVFFGGPYEVTVTIMNNGVEALDIGDISADIGEFYADPDNLVLEPGESADVMFIFNAENAGEYEGTMTISSNDPYDDAYGIICLAKAEEPPVISLDPNSIEEDLLTDDIEEYVVILANDGEADLHWETELEIIQEPGMEEDERDDARRNVRETAPLRDTGASDTRFNENSGMPNSENGEAVEAYMLQNPLDDDRAPL